MQRQNPAHPLDRCRRHGPPAVDAAAQCAKRDLYAELSKLPVKPDQLEFIQTVADRDSSIVQRRPTQIAYAVRKQTTMRRVFVSPSSLRHSDFGLIVNLIEM